MILVCTVGLPGAGKTTWADATGWPVISPDRIRYGCTGAPVYYHQPDYRVWDDIMWSSVRTAIQKHQRMGAPFIVLDSTGTDLQKRTAFREWGQKVKATVLFMVFHTGREVCKERLRAAERFPDLQSLDTHVELMRHVAVDLRPAGDYRLPVNPGTPFEGVLRG